MRHGPTRNPERRRPVVGIAEAQANTCVSNHNGRIENGCKSQDQWVTTSEHSLGSNVTVDVDSIVLVVFAYG